MSYNYTCNVVGCDTDGHKYGCPQSVSTKTSSGIRELIGRDELIINLRDEIEMLKGCIDYINPTSDDVEGLIKDYKLYLKGFD